jgi:hypothetical protein
MRPVPHLERIIDKDDASRLIVRTNLQPQKLNEGAELLHSAERGNTERGGTSYIFRKQ